MQCFPRLKRCCGLAGTRKEAYLEQNQAAAQIKLTREEMAAIEAAIPLAEVSLTCSVCACRDPLAVHVPVLRVLFCLLL